VPQRWGGYARHARNASERRRNEPVSRSRKNRGSISAAFSDFRTRRSISDRSPARSPPRGQWSIPRTRVGDETRAVTRSHFLYVLQNVITYVAPLRYVSSDFLHSRMETQINASRIFPRDDRTCLYKRNYGGNV